MGSSLCSASVSPPQGPTWPLLENIHPVQAHRAPPPAAQGSGLPPGSGQGGIGEGHDLHSHVGSCPPLSLPQHSQHRPWVSAAAPARADQQTPAHHLPALPVSALWFGPWKWMLSATVKFIYEEYGGRRLQASGGSGPLSYPHPPSCSRPSQPRCTPASPGPGKEALGSGVGTEGTGPLPHVGVTW